MGEGDDDCGSGGVSGENVYKRRTEPVLVLLSDLYSKDDRILGR